MKHLWNILALVPASVHALDVCHVGTISALSRQGAIISILSCVENATTLHFLSQPDVNNVISNCVNLVMSLAPTHSPASVSQCFACYKGLVSDIFGLIIGTINSGGFAPTTSTLSSACSNLTTAAGIELCLKNPDLRSPLLTFQKCSGYAVIYPAAGSLAIRRMFSRADIFGNILRSSLGSGGPFVGVLAQVTASSNTPATSQSILLMEICYLTLMEDLSIMKPTLSLTVIRDCNSAHASDVCLSNSLIIDAMSRFVSCSGFKVDVFPVACSVDVLSKIYGNYDAIANLLPQIILNFASTPNAFLASIQPAIASISQFGNSDCAICFQELAIDIASNIQAQKTTLSTDQFATYIGGCSDPHSTECNLLIGTEALQNFEECSGSTLNLMASTTRTPAVSPASTTTSTTTPANLMGQSVPLPAQKSSSRADVLMYATALIFSTIIPSILA